MTGVRQPTFLSLFAGCGGLDLGFVQAGFKSLLSVDLDAVAMGVHRKNLAGPVELMDLAIELPSIGSQASVDVLLAGSPCQGFSTVGLRRVDDPRNSLLLIAAKAAVCTGAKVVVAENVLGALSGSHRSYWDQLHGRLRALGYSTHDVHVDSHQFGVPQHRRRVFLVAWKTRAMPSFFFEKRGACVLADVLKDLNGLPNHAPAPLDLRTTDYKIARRIGQGQKLTNSRAGDTAVHTWEIPEVFGSTNARERYVLGEILKLRRQNRRRDYGDADPISTRALVGAYGTELIETLVAKKYLRRLGRYHDLTNTFNGKYRRLRADAPSRTVDTKFGEARLFLHPIEHRSFTVREAARIQGFPDEFVFDGTLKEQFRMIGNAVPPPVAKAVAQTVRTLL